VKNTDYLVFLVAKHGVTTRFVKDARGWVETSPAGTKHRCTAEQVLNHLLPALVLGDSVIKTKVLLKKGRRFHPLLEKMRTSGHRLK